MGGTVDHMHQTIHNGFGDFGDFTMRLQTYTNLPYQKKNPKNASSVYYIYFIMSLARSSYLYLQHVATQKKLNGVQSYSQLHPNAQNKLHES
jgi:hypothetical protein